jgi:PAS domain S-box-containing protein
MNTPLQETTSLLDRFLQASHLAASELPRRRHHQDLADAAVGLLVDRFGASGAEVMLWRPDREALELEASAGIARPVAAMTEPLRLAQAPPEVRIAIQTRTTQVRPVLAVPPPGVPTPPQGGTLTALPLLGRDELLGVLLATFNQALDRDPILALESFAGLLSASLDSVRDLERERQRRKRFEDFIEGMNHGLAWEADPGTLQLRFVSHRAERLFGYPARQWIEEPAFWIDRVHPDDRAAVVSSLGAAAHGGKDISFEHRFITASGAVLWFKTSVHLARRGPDAGKVLHGLSSDITQQKQTESELREQLAFTNSVMSSISKGVYTIDRRGCLTSLNAAGERLLGWKADELLGREIHDVIHRQERSGTAIPPGASPLLGVIQSGLPLSSEDGLFTRHDGSTFPVRYSAAPLRRDGTVHGAVVAFTDITEHLKQLEALALQEQYSALRADASAATSAGGDLRVMLQTCAQACVDRLDAAFVRIWLLDEAHGVLLLQASAGMYTHLDGEHARIAVGSREVGRVAAERKPRLINDVAGDPRIQDPAWARTIGMKAFAGCPMLVDGRLIGVLAMFSRHVLPAQTLDVLTAVAGMVGQGVERKRAQEALIVRERYLRFLAAASEELASSLDYETTLARVATLAVPELAAWCVVDVAAADGWGPLYAVAHVDPEQISLARDMRRRYPPVPSSARGPAAVLREGKPELIREVTDDVLQSYARDPEHLRLLRALRIHSYMCVPMIARGRAVGTITLGGSDPRRPFSTEDLAAAEEVARRAAAAVENARLYRQTQKAVQARDDFLSIASHELRTPLTPLQLQIQNLEQVARRNISELPKERLVRNLGTARRQVERLAGLVESLLDVSRIRAGRLELELHTFDLSVMVREIVARLREEAGRLGSEIIVRADEAVIGRWDRPRLEQVVTNLLSNALKYGAHRPVEIRTFRGHSEAILRVTDRGIGIPRRDIDRVFGRFERASDLRSYGGLGLGLYIVQHIVDAHRGHIDVSSHEGEGSSFQISLPLDPEMAPEPVPPAGVHAGAG